MSDQRKTPKEQDTMRQQEIVGAPRPAAGQEIANAPPTQNQAPGQQNQPRSTGSRLLDLPAELRNQIYAYVYDAEVDIRFCTAGKRNAGLLLANRQLHRETFSYYYPTTHFLCHGDDFDIYWLRTIRARNRDAIEEIRCDVTLTGWGYRWGSEEEHQAQQRAKMREFVEKLEAARIVMREVVLRVRKEGEGRGREEWVVWVDSQPEAG